MPTSVYQKYSKSWEYKIKLAVNTTTILITAIVNGYFNYCEKDTHINRLKIKNKLKVAK